jgi:hypothetical protein
LAFFGAEEKKRVVRVIHNRAEDRRQVGARDPYQGG